MSLYSDMYITILLLSEHYLLHFLFNTINISTAHRESSLHSQDHGQVALCLNPQSYSHCYLVHIVMLPCYDFPYNGLLLLCLWNFYSFKSSLRVVLPWYSLQYRYYCLKIYSNKIFVLRSVQSSEFFPACQESLNRLLLNQPCARHDHALAVN